jgi:hypothetical protein
LDPTPLLPYSDNDKAWYNFPEQRGDETTSITDESDSNATSVAWCSVGNRDDWGSLAKVDLNNELTITQNWAPEGRF